MRYWLGVVSKNHVQRGVNGGFAQVCHGKKAPLMKMAAGDGLIYYSPKIAMDNPEKCQCFTAIGQIKNGKVYQVEMTTDFHPFRIDVDYALCRETPLADVFHQLELTKSKSWGIQLRRGLIELNAADFKALATAMQLRGRQIINFRVIEEKNGSDFENFLETGIASIPARKNRQ
jgi:hypothetical protein